MSAQWVDDEPISYAITVAGWRAIAPSLTSRHAAGVLRLSEAQVSRLAKRGEISGAKVEGAWVLDRASVEDYPARRDARLAELAARPRAVRLDAAPLLDAVAARGGPSGCGVPRGSAEQQALERARAEGTLTIWMADRLAVRLLGVTVWELWPDVG